MGDMKLPSYEKFEREEQEEMAPGSEHREIVPGHYKEPSCALTEQSTNT